MFTMVTLPQTNVNVVYILSDRKGKGTGAVGVPISRPRQERPASSMLAKRAAYRVGGPPSMRGAAHLGPSTYGGHRSAEAGCLEDLERSGQEVGP